MEPPKFIALNQKKESIMKERVKPVSVLHLKQVEALNFGNQRKYLKRVPQLKVNE